MDKRLKKILRILAWLTIIIFFGLGLILRFNPHIIYEYSIITAIFQNLWWLMLIASLILVFVKNKDDGENTDKKNGKKNPPYQFTIIQSLFMILAVGLGMFAIAALTDSFGLGGIIGAMIGTSLYLFSNYIGREK